MTLNSRISEQAGGPQPTVLRASFARRGDSTILASKYHTAPVKIAKTFPHGSLGLAAIVMDVSPGLLDGDRYEFDWQCGAGSQVFLTNQSFTKVHPAGTSGGSSMRQTFVLEEGAIVEHMPEPVMLYKEAAFRSETEVRLSPGAVWMQADVWCPGRTLRGETFQYRRFDSRLKAWYGDELICAQRQLIEPASQALQSAGCWEQATHIGTLFILGDRVGSMQLEAVRTALESLPDRQSYGLGFGASLAYKHGLSVMAAGTAAWPLQEALHAAWRAARLSLVGEELQTLLRI